MGSPFLRPSWVPDSSCRHPACFGRGQCWCSYESLSISFPSVIHPSHTFVATVEGQASVVKGDSLQLLDDSNSYWWLVNVLKTEDVGYIPAENIETPFERLARLNKFRNVDVSHSDVDVWHMPRAPRNKPGRAGSSDQSPTDDPVTDNLNIA